MEISEPISFTMSVLSTVVAIWQIIKNYNLKKYIKTEAMQYYSDSGILLGSTQGCLRELQNGNTNLSIQEAGKSEGMAQALFNRSIKNIYHNFHFTRADIEEWINNKKINTFHREAFLKYAEK